VSTAKLYIGNSVLKNVHVNRAHILNVKKSGDEFKQEDFHARHVIKSSPDVNFVQINASGWALDDGIPDIFLDFVESSVGMSNIRKVYFECRINTLRGDLSKNFRLLEKESHRKRAKSGFLETLRLFSMFFPQTKIVYLGTSVLRSSIVEGRGFPPGCMDDILKSRGKDVSWFLAQVLRLSRFVTSYGDDFVGVPFVYLNVFRGISSEDVYDAWGHLYHLSLGRFAGRFEEVLLARGKCNLLLAFGFDF